MGEPDNFVDIFSAKWLNLRQKLDIDDSDFWLWTDVPSSEPASLVSAHGSRAEWCYNR